MSLAAQLSEAIEPLFEGANFVDTTKPGWRDKFEGWAHDIVWLATKTDKIFIKDPEFQNLEDYGYEHRRLFEEIREWAVSVTHDAETAGAWEGPGQPWDRRDAAMMKDLKRASMSLQKVKGKSSEGWKLTITPSLASIWRKHKTWPYH